MARTEGQNVLCGAAQIWQAGKQGRVGGVDHRHIAIEKGLDFGQIGTKTCIIAQVGKDRCLTNGGDTAVENIEFAAQVEQVRRRLGQTFGELQKFEISL